VKDNVDDLHGSGSMMWSRHHRINDDDDDGRQRQEENICGWILWSLLTMGSQEEERFYSYF